MKLTNLTNREIFIGNPGKFDPIGHMAFKQGIKLLPTGDPSGRDVRDGLPDHLYSQAFEIRALEVAGDILVEFSSDPTSGVAEPELTGGGGGIVGASQVFALQERRHSNNLIAWRTASRTMIDFDAIDTSLIKLHWNQVLVPGGADSAELRLRNTSDGLDLVVVTGIVSTGSKTTFLGAVPSGLKAVALQHQVTGGGFSRIEGAAIYAG